MRAAGLIFRYILLLWVVSRTTAALADNIAESIHCKGGSIYFAAHPADILFYQTPDFYHDLYVFKCTTVVLFTSSGVGGYGTPLDSIEQGFENAVASMAGKPIDGTAWDQTNMTMRTRSIVSRSLKDLPNVQIIYLRLPGGMPDGQAYPGNKGGTLSQLYTQQVQNTTSSDNNNIYTLFFLNELLSSIMSERQANDICVLDYRAALPEPNETGCEHADHSVSARLVLEAMRYGRYRANIRGYAGNIMHEFNPSFQEGTVDYAAKAEALFHYAAFDEHMCNTREQCLSNASERPTNSTAHGDDPDFVAEWLVREYYVH
ncbi:hypothetical protein K491DRAFT_403290 [Lophiostoma macrostomum CBS 122681]|uniref:Uncharacterized protein n=1 Tax=Lophiostoma macrostomum CBS 122681 TaxID=1314788 RepID=A0A6A6TBP4_9PLEO|nr:hypothetical protein K491DRAFT_403290 [Lophiostoma macrostomum CBS 122681]